MNTVKEKNEYVTSACIYTHKRKTSVAERDRDKEMDRVGESAMRQRE